MHAGDTGWKPCPENFLLSRVCVVLLIRYDDVAFRFATGTLARIVSDDLVTWPLGPGAHGSTHVARLAPHGTLQHCSFNQLKGFVSATPPLPSSCMMQLPAVSNVPIASVGAYVLWRDMHMMQ